MLKQIDKTYCWRCGTLFRITSGHRCKLENDSSDPFEGVPWEGGHSLIKSETQDQKMDRIIKMLEELLSR